MEFPGMVYHSHILPHEENMMMRPIMLQPSEAYLDLTANTTSNVSISCIKGMIWEENANCINQVLGCWSKWLTSSVWFRRCEFCQLLKVGICTLLKRFIYRMKFSMKKKTLIKKKRKMTILLELEQIILWDSFVSDHFSYSGWMLILKIKKAVLFFKWKTRYSYRQILTLYPHS